LHKHFLKERAELEAVPELLLEAVPELLLEPILEAVPEAEAVPGAHTFLLEAEALEAEALKGWKWKR
jgi:hypothetical protein